MVMSVNELNELLLFFEGDGRAVSSLQACASTVEPENAAGGRSIP
jgi:hypothetical protein